MCNLPGDIIGIEAINATTAVIMVKDSSALYIYDISRQQIPLSTLPARLNIVKVIALNPPYGTLLLTVDL